MTSQVDELTGRKLDTAVAEAMGGDPSGHPYTAWAAFWPTDPGVNHFGSVKREIERRGWDWQCWSKADSALGRFYTFQIYSIASMEKNGMVSLYEHAMIGHGVANLEEVAGCRAFLMACGADRGEKGER